MYIVDPRYFYGPLLNSNGDATESRGPRVGYLSRWVICRPNIVVLASVLLFWSLLFSRELIAL